MLSACFGEADGAIQASAQEDEPRSLWPLGAA